jgi:hypothetical protein
MFQSKSDFYTRNVNIDRMRGVGALISCVCVVYVKLFAWSPIKELRQFFTKVIHQVLGSILNSM